jgi:hypothetical protein
VSGFLKIFVDKIRRMIAFPKSQEMVYALCDLESLSSHLYFSRMFLLVGAPKANTTQPGIVEGGQVLKCDWSSHRRCQPIEFDATGKHLYGGPFA